MQTSYLNRLEDPGLDEAQSYLIVTNGFFWKSGGLYGNKELRKDSVDRLRKVIVV
jgi:hypothetical protein